MAKVLCGISGIEFQVEHLSISLSSREYAHPVFFLPQKKLLGLYSKYQQGELNSIDSYLVFLAYLNSTDLVEWRVPASRNALTDSIVAQNFENLISVIEKMNRIPHYLDHMFKVAVTPDTKSLGNIEVWIAGWEQTYDDFTSGYAAEKKKQELAEIESRLQSLLYSSEVGATSSAQFAAKLAVWADKAGSFPRFPVSISNSTSIPCNEYWKQIIRKCTSSESIFSIPSADLEELISHCEEYIEAGNTFAHHLFRVLREGKERQGNFLGLGDFSFSIVAQDTSVETANKLSIIQNAPSSEPVRISYPSQFAYIKAKLAWDMSKDATNASTSVV